MLPVLLYNNMEGNSNQLNNTANSSFGLAYDDSVILNSVRTRKKVTELPNCPVCSCTIRQGELETHMALEVERLQKLSVGGGKRKLSATCPSPMPGASTSAGVAAVGEEAEVDVSGCPGSDVYQRVHNNRLRRLRTRARRAPAETGECPLCDATLPVSRLQRHALRCLKRSGAEVDDDVPDSSEEEGSIDVENDSPSAGGGGSFGAEYRWCGEWRVRATALAEGGAAGHTAVRRASNDRALVVDGDEDTELYGPPQYSPSRIAPDADPVPDDRPDDPPGHVNGSDSTIEEPECEPMEAPTCGRKINGVVELSAETRIQALKCRIKELEARQNSGSEAKCLICLGPHTSPTVSIQCWHVYCEICWLDSLRAKKICPQCNAITTAQHLRRIYM